jgi:HEAT repeat protein
LGDEDSTVRWAAAGALGNIGDAKAIEPLREVAGDDSSEDVREAAKEALNRIQQKIAK